MGYRASDKSRCSFCQIAFDDYARARILLERLDVDVRVAGTWGKVGDVARVPDLHGDRLQGQRRQTRSGERERLAFRPERFIENPPSNTEYLPFGGGVRRCLGASFAQFEMKIVLGTIMRHARVRAAEPGAERIRRRSITFAPSSGGRIVARAA